MKTRHHVLIKSTCPVNGDTDFYDCFIYTINRILPCEEVADAVETLTRAPVYQEALTQQLADKLRCKVKTVGRHTAGKIPWGQIEALFVGGSDDFKEDMLVTCDILPQAKARGKWVHLGRCNSRSRLRLALRSDCDSVDGSSLSMFPRTWIPKFVGWIKELQQEVQDDDVLLCDLKWQLLAGPHLHAM